MQSNLLRFKTDQKYILFDLESCSLNLRDPENKPWQIGFILGTGQKLDSVHCYYVKWPDLRVSPEAAAVTRFSYDIYNKNAQDPKKVLDIFEQYIYNPEYLIVGHNILGFDVYLHNIWRRLLGRKTDYSYIPRCIDTNAIAKAVKTGAQYNEKMNFVAFQYSVLDKIVAGVKTRLEVLGKEFEIDFDKDSLHDAANDCLLNWNVWNKLKYAIEI